MYGKVIQFSSEIRELILLIFSKVIETYSIHNLAQNIVCRMIWNHSSSIRIKTIILKSIEECSKQQEKKNNLYHRIIYSNDWLHYYSMIFEICASLRMVDFSFFLSQINSRLIWMNIKTHIFAYTTWFEFLACHCKWATYCNEWYHTGRGKNINYVVKMLYTKGKK